MLQPWPASPTRDRHHSRQGELQNNLNILQPFIYQTKTMKTTILKILLSLFLLSSANAEEELHHEIRALQLRYQSELKKLNDAYIAQLEKMKDKFTKAARLKEANQVSRTIAAIPDPSEDAPSDKELPSLPKTWNWGTGGTTLSLLPKGVVKHSVWEIKTRWARLPDGSLIISNPSHIFHCTFNHLNEGTVTNITSGLKTTMTPKE
jgi:hypothetical protein